MDNTSEINKAFLKIDKRKNQLEKALNELRQLIGGAAGCPHCYSTKSRKYHISYKKGINDFFVCLDCGRSFCDNY